MEGDGALAIELQLVEPPQIVRQLLRLQQHWRDEPRLLHQRVYVRPCVRISADAAGSGPEALARALGVSLPKLLSDLRQPDQPIVRRGRPTLRMRCLLDKVAEQIFFDLWRADFPNTTIDEVVMNIDEGQENHGTKR